MDRQRFVELASVNGYGETTCEDFLEWENTGKPFDRVLMNPPFRSETDPVAWMAHIRHAFSMLATSGILVAIVPEGFSFRTDRKHREFFQWATANALHTHSLPSSAFKESGTGVNVRLIRIER